MRSKRLSELLAGVESSVRGPSDIAISDVVFDSRQVRPGCLFVAIKGVHHDGHGFVSDAAAAGAAAVLVDSPVPEVAASIVRVPDTLRALAPIAVRFFDRPSERLRLVGITGTNGKTTTSYLIESIFETAGWKTGVLGTIAYRFGGDAVPAPNTTPLASELQRFLARIVAGGGQACVMEVSSHALALGRVDGVEFDVGVFTNLTQDHLDFHKTMDEYAEAKARLFSGLDPSTTKRFPKGAVVNFDDPSASRMVRDCKVPVLRYRLKGQADLTATDVVSDASGSRFLLHGPNGLRLPVNLQLLGDYNVENALAAAGAALTQGLDGELIRRGLERLRGVPGRMERVLAGQPFTVVVDYAHTEDALRHVMTALRRLKPKRLITVFGCGGDRDRTKRPLMGEAAARLSDEVIVTSDNPRSEDPSKIALDIEVGVRRAPDARYQIALDREEAVQKALALAQAGDIVLIAGKGHETYQILGERTIPFDDRDVARRVLAARGYR